jgi:hypothetical protein
MMDCRKLPGRHYVPTIFYTGKVELLKRQSENKFIAGCGEYNIYYRGGHRIDARLDYQHLATITFF